MRKWGSQGKENSEVQALKTDLKRAFGSWGFIAAVIGFAVAAFFGVAGQILPILQEKTGGRPCGGIFYPAFHRLAENGCGAAGAAHTRRAALHDRLCRRPQKPLFARVSSARRQTALPCFARGGDRAFGRAGALLGRVSAPVLRLPCCLRRWNLCPRRRKSLRERWL